MTSIRRNEVSRLCSCPGDAIEGNPPDIVAETGVCLDQPNITFRNRWRRINQAGGYCEDHMIVNVCTNAIFCCSGTKQTQAGGYVNTYQPCEFGNDGGSSCLTFVDVKNFGANRPSGLDLFGADTVITTSGSVTQDANDDVVSSLCYTTHIVVTGASGTCFEERCYQVSAKTACGVGVGLPQYQPNTSPTDKNIICFNEGDFLAGGNLSLMDILLSNSGLYPQPVTTSGQYPIFDNDGGGDSPSTGTP